jgi:hypothetical protein
MKQGFALGFVHYVIPPCPSLGHVFRHFSRDVPQAFRHGLVDTVLSLVHWIRLPKVSKGSREKREQLYFKETTLLFKQIPEYH